MSEDSVEIVWNVADHGNASGDYFYKVIPRSDEYVVLQYSLMPQYQSAFLREYFIGPQKFIDDHSCSERDYNYSAAIGKLWKKDEAKNKTGYECGRANQGSGS